MTKRACLCACMCVVCGCMCVYVRRVRTCVCVSVWHVHACVRSYLKLIKTLWCRYHHYPDFAADEAGATRVGSRAMLKVQVIRLQIWCFHYHSHRSSTTLTALYMGRFCKISVSKYSALKKQSLFNKKKDIHSPFSSYKNSITLKSYFKEKSGIEYP